VDGPPIKRGHEWKIHSWVEDPLIESERCGGTTWGILHPLYIYIGVEAPSPYTTHHLYSSSCWSTSWALAWWSSVQIGSWPSQRCRATRVFQWIFYFHCPDGSREWRLSSSRMYEQVRKRCWFAALIFVILRLASVRLHHPRDLIFLALCSSRVSPSTTWFTRLVSLLD
jgi:hypothetical protein